MREKLSEYQFFFFMLKHKQEIVCGSSILFIINSLKLHNMKLILHIHQLWITYITQRFFYNIISQRLVLVFGDMIVMILMKCIRRKLINHMLNLNY